jgi:predicted metal-binding protein
MHLIEKIGQIEQLEQAAQIMGFDVCCPVLVRDVHVDERVRMHCQLNLCTHYGQNLMCPPFLPSLEEIRLMLGNYTFGLLLQIKRILDSADKEHMRDVFNSAALELTRMIVSLERMAFGAGFNLAMALGAGECKICPRCVVQNGERCCAQPGAARPSMEGMGIDVIRTFANAGIPIEFRPDKVCVAGLLLID